MAEAIVIKCQAQTIAVCRHAISYSLILIGCAQYHKSELCFSRLLNRRIWFINPLMKGRLDVLILCSI